VQQRTSIARLVGLATLLGSGFLWIKMGLDGLSPVQIVLGRLALGSLVLLALVRSRGLSLPRDAGTWAHLFVAALFANALPYLLYGVGEQSVDSSVAGVLNATTPLWAVTLGLAAGTERHLTRRRGLGLVLGFVGAVVVLGPWHGGASGTVGGSLACLGAASSFGFGFVYMGRHLVTRGIPPLVLSASQLAAATGITAVATPVIGRQPVSLSPHVVVALLVLGVFGTGIAYALNYRLIHDEGPTVTSTVTYLIPVFAVLLGFVVLGEPLSPRLAVGTAVVLAGVALVQRSRPVRLRVRG